MFQCAWIFFSLFHITVQVPILEDDSWNLDLPLDLDLDDDGSRSVKTTRPLVVLCRHDNLVTHRPPGNDDQYILVKPSGDLSLSTKGPCFITRHPPVLRRPTTPSSDLNKLSTNFGNLAVWPAIVVGTPSSGQEILDENALQNVASQLVGDERWDFAPTTNLPGEIVHANLIYTTPPTQEVEVPCGCDGEDDVHTHEYLPNEEKHTHRPVTSNEINIPTRINPDENPTSTQKIEVTKFATTTTKTITRSFAPSSDVQIFTRQPEEPLLWSASTPAPTTTSSLKVFTNVVTSTSGIDHTEKNQFPPTPVHVKTKPTTTPVKFKPTTAPPPKVNTPIIEYLDDDSSSSAVYSTDKPTSVVGGGKLMNLLYFISKQALFLLFTLFLFVFVGRKSESSSLSPTTPPGVMNYLHVDNDGDNLLKIYKNVIWSLNKGLKKEEAVYGLSYPLPTNYANSQDSDVYDTQSGEHLVQLDYILNVINDVKNNANYNNTSVKGYG